jgi:tetratricopeptide (TPR) repeat protein
MTSNTAEPLREVSSPGPYSDAPSGPTFAPPAAPCAAGTGSELAAIDDAAGTAAEVSPPAQPAAAAIDEVRRALSGALGQERLRLLTELTALHESLGEIAQARHYCEQALLLQPDDTARVYQCTEMCVVQEAWSDALVLLERLAARQSRAEVRAGYRWLAAGIRERKLGDDAGAIAQLSAALRDAPGDARVAASLERLLAARGAWSELADCHIWRLRHLERAGEHRRDARFARHFGALVELCPRLDDPGQAARALDAAISLGDPQEDRPRLLALYHASEPAVLARTIAARQEHLGHHKSRAAGYRVLADLYAASGHPRAAAACEAALALLERRTGDAAALIPPRPGLQQLDGRHWRELRHRDEDPRLGRILVLLGPALLRASAPDWRASIAGTERLTPRSRHAALLTRLRMLLCTMGLPALNACCDPHQEQPVRLVLGRRHGRLVPAVVFGRAALDAAADSTDTVFALARQLTFLRADRAVRLLGDPRGAVAAALQAAIDFGTAPAGTASPALVAALDETQRIELRLLGSCLAATGEPVPRQVRRWCHAIERTAIRAGFLVAGDLVACVRRLEEERRLPARVTASGMALDLIWFSITSTSLAAHRLLEDAPQVADAAANPAAAAPARAAGPTEAVAAVPADRAGVAPCDRAEPPHASADAGPAPA